MRFEGKMNVDINDIVTNLVPFPKLHFLTSSMTPFFTNTDIRHSTKQYVSLTSIDQLFTDVFTSSAQLLSIEPKQSTYLASLLICRGAIQITDLRRNIDRISKGLKFVDWNTSAWKTGLCDVPSAKSPYSVLSMSNSTGVATVLDHLGTRFKKLYSRKAHVHHYLEYMEKKEFDDARDAVMDICRDYQRMDQSHTPLTA